MIDKTNDIWLRVFRAILFGKYKPGDRLPTERDMALSTKTSRITVRRAYARLGKTGIIERSRKRGTFISTRWRGNTERPDVIALLASVRDPFMLDFISALETALSREEALLILKLTDDNPAREESAAIEIVSKGVRNMIVWPSGGRFRAGVFARLRILGVNMVFFDRVLPGVIADFVGLDNAHAVHSLVGHAGLAGVRDFVFVSHSGLEADSDRQREEAFSAECARRGMAGRVVRVPWKGDVHSVLCANARQWFMAKPKMAAICVNDQVALEVLNVVPSSVAVYGVDGRKAAVEVGVTSYAQPMAAMADKAIQLIYNQQKLGAAWQARAVYCRGKLVGRKNEKREQGNRI